MSTSRAPFLKAQGDQNGKSHSPYWKLLLHRSEADQAVPAFSFGGFRFLQQHGNKLMGASPLDGSSALD